MFGKCDGDCVSIRLWRVRSAGDNMGIVDRIKDWLFGIDFVSTAQIRELMEYIITDVDTNEDGWISVREFIQAVKTWMKLNS